MNGRFRHTEITTSNPQSYRTLTILKEVEGKSSQINMQSTGPLHDTCSAFFGEVIAKKVFLAMV